MFIVPHQELSSGLIGSKLISSEEVGCYLRALSGGFLPVRVTAIRFARIKASRFSVFVIISS
jgi:hypothetical protein